MNESPAPAPSPRAMGAKPSLEPIAEQIVKLVPPLRSQRFSTLMDFETDADGVFIGSRPQGFFVYDRAHTGQRSVRFDSSSTRIIVKLGSVMSGRAFPSDWTLLGVYLNCDQPLELSMMIRGTGFEIPARQISIAGNSWTCALLDITTNPKPGQTKLPDDARIVLSLPAHHPPVWIDDVLLIDNSEVLVSSDRVFAPSPSTEPTSTPTGAPTGSPVTTQPAEGDVRSAWMLKRRGLNYVGAMPGKFNFSLMSDEASRAGWKLEEANALRARFSSEGDQKQRTVYADGRAYLDGKFDPMSAEARDNREYADEHATPAEIEIAPELGRVNRDTPGDANNDGYNEVRGAYQLVASGARMELKFTPHTPVVMSPVLEISGLPPGAILATIEGRLIENSVRLSDGSLLVELPVKIDRPTTINLRTQ